MILHDSPFYRCWAFNENMNYWWIIRLPILFASLVSDWISTHCKCVVHAQLTYWFFDQQINFLIFMKILKVILSKLRANKQSGYPDYKLRQVDPLHCEYKIYIELIVL